MYESLIKSLGGWASMTDAQIVANLVAVDQPYAEPEKWMSLGIASIIGEENMPALLAFMESSGREWLRQDMAFPGLPIGDATFNTKLLQTGNPLCVQIANYGRRLVSRCYAAGLAEDTEAILATISKMRLELRKSAWRASFAARYNAAMAAVASYDGSGPEPNL